MPFALVLPKSDNLSGNCWQWRRKSSLERGGAPGDGIRPSNWQKAANFGRRAIQKPDSVTQQTLALSRSRRPVASQIGPHDGREALDVRHRDLVRSKAEDAPAAQSRLQILLTRARLTGVSPFGLRCAQSISPPASRLGSRSALNPAARLCRPFTQMPPSISMRQCVGKCAKSALQRRLRSKRYSLSSSGPPARLQSLRKDSSRREGGVGAR